AIAELGGQHTLHHARAAIAAIGVLGRAAERIAVGLGPADNVASAELGIEHDRVQRQLAKLVAGRVGDHETKVLLAAYKVPITRQAVATTPSAAVKTARRAGFPVEIKPWGHDVPTERANCPVERDITSDALVRKAYTTVLAAAGRSLDDTGAVIVRETPPSGREVSAAFVKLSSLGWTVVLDVPGAPQIAAAPAPLRAIDAKALASHVVASRAGDPEPDRVGLANLLRRASHLVVDLDDRLVRLELPRIIVGGGASRTLVVDAFAELG
ncbi:MAG TPA: acetate--CoA ligase family protein, partial [Kofleriaceae bacterium]|nr:acetate--CoA ligase family protein [Kofleriaceae bacterium]